MWTEVQSHCLAVKPSKNSGASLCKTCRALLQSEEAAGTSQQTWQLGRKAAPLFWVRKTVFALELEQETRIYWVTNTCEGWYQLLPGAVSHLGGGCIPTLQMKIQMFWVVESCRLSGGLDCRVTAGFFWKKALVLSYELSYVPPENGCLLPLHCKPGRQQSWIMESPRLGGGTCILISGGDSGTGHRAFLSPVGREKRWQYWWLWRWKRKRIWKCLSALKRGRKKALLPTGRLRFQWVWGPPSCWPSDEPFPAAPWLKRRSAQRWGQGQSRNPCGGRTGPGRTVISVIDVGPSIKGWSTPLWGRGASLCLFHCCGKVGANHWAPGLLSTISCMISSIFFCLSITSSHPWSLMGIFTMGFLCCRSHWPKHCSVKREVNWVDPISTDKLWGELRGPISGLMNKSLPGLSLGGRCYFKKSGVRVLLAPENSWALLWAFE